MTRLTDEDRAAIRKLYAEPGPRRWTQDALAAEFGVSAQAVHLVVNDEARQRHNARAAAYAKARRQVDPARRARDAENNKRWFQENREWRREHDRRRNAARRAAKMAAE